MSNFATIGVAREDALKEYFVKEAEDKRQQRPASSYYQNQAAIAKMNRKYKYWTTVNELLFESGF